MRTTQDLMLPPFDQAAFWRTGYATPRGGAFQPGMYGRMFPLLTGHRARDSDLVKLGSAMTEPSDRVGRSELDHETLPAGYTYFGQFVDHDVTFDTTPLPEVSIDPLAVRNFRTPRLDLDSVYGNGPIAHPHLYDRDGRRFAIGRTARSTDVDGRLLDPLPNDLPRGPQGFAIIADPRNDENLILAQLHLAFMKFHNKLAARRPELSFIELRRVVTWHYQWIVLHDFLPRIIDEGERSRVLREGRRHYSFNGECFIPVEFSTAAYRLHTLVREEYDYNRLFGPRPPERRLGRAPLLLLGTFTGLRGDGSTVPILSSWIIDWRRFFEIRSASPSPVNRSRRIDALLTPALNSMVMGPSRELNRLPVRNLLRGSRLGLPSGQDVACALGLRAQIVPPASIARGRDGEVAQSLGFAESTPLWYYLMKEAEILGQSQRLGPVGSRILAEVFVGLLEGDETSFLAASPSWRPFLGPGDGTFTMSDLLVFVDDLNPLGD